MQQLSHTVTVASTESLDLDYKTKDNKTVLVYYFTVPCRKFRLPCLGKAQQLQEQHCLFLLVSAVFL